MDSPELGPISPSQQREAVRVVRTYLAMARPDQLVRGAPPWLAAELVELPRCPVAEWRHL